MALNYILRYGGENTRFEIHSTGEDIFLIYHQIMRTKIKPMHSYW